MEIPYPGNPHSEVIGLGKHMVTSQPKGVTKGRQWLAVLRTLASRKGAKCDRT